VDWTVTPRIALNGYYGLAHGAAITQAIYSGDRSGSLGYLEIVLRWP
jgi:hypothetical protein